MFRRRVERPDAAIGGLKYRLTFLTQAVANLCKSENNRAALAKEGIVDLLAGVIGSTEERPGAQEFAAGALYSLSFDAKALEAMQQSSARGVVSIMSPLTWILRGLVR